MVVPNCVHAYAKKSASVRHTRLVAKRECPIIVRVFIDNNKVISKKQKYL
jgi:hypothetical protein